MLRRRAVIFIPLFLIILMSIISPTLTVTNLATHELIREGSSTGGTYTLIAITDVQNSPILIEPKNDTAYPIGVVLVFNWTSVENATSYTLYIDISTYFNSACLVKVSNLTSTHYSLNTNTLEPNHVYYWKVCALLSNDTIVSSDVFTFEVIERDNPLVGSIWTSLLVVAAMIAIYLLIIRLRKYKSSY
ncbi:MAG: hypothetical protein DRP47_10305 [Candidatus Zixiibacteriota bacterium]|nr:MAG: hypothetical protein DRP47_10305 [candidate division Zixibacteria bacterium]